MLTRDEAATAIARAPGFGRAGRRIAEAIDSALLAAVRRRVIFNERGQFGLLWRRIDQYSLDDRIAALLGAIGRGWIERETAITAAARYLGFRRTGSAIREAFKAAITAAIRRGLLEYDGQQVRRL